MSKTLYTDGTDNTVSTDFFRNFRKIRVIRVQALSPDITSNLCASSGASSDETGHPV